MFYDKTDIKWSPFYIFSRKWSEEEEPSSLSRQTLATDFYVNGHRWEKKEGKIIGKKDIIEEIENELPDITDEPPQKIARKDQTPTETPLQEYMAKFQESLEQLQAVESITEQSDFHFMDQQEGLVDMSALVKVEVNELEKKDEVPQFLVKSDYDDVSTFGYEAYENRYNSYTNNNMYASQWAERGFYGIENEKGDIKCLTCFGCTRKIERVNKKTTLADLHAMVLDHHNSCDRRDNISTEEKNLTVILLKALDVFIHAESVDTYKKCGLNRGVQKFIRDNRLCVVFEGELLKIMDPEKRCKFNVYQPVRLTEEELRQYFLDSIREKPDKEVVGNAVRRLAEMHEDKSLFSILLALVKHGRIKSSHELGLIIEILCEHMKEKFGTMVDNMLIK